MSGAVLRIAASALVLAVIDAVTVPVVAACGISDWRGMEAVLMLGAAGIWVGTRFLASSEAKMRHGGPISWLGCLGEASGPRSSDRGQ